MEVAGQWRREWAGTAEYGKVTEGGVTRRVARAMEVLQASGPGARVRVMRAAYHSTSGPGLPASSYMLHSSRRVISSGFNILESPTFPSKPLEISSTPFESSPDSNMETENYKVTEPDDIDISEPSKWRGSTGGNAIRMPSEESSSTDNASIIDLDSKLHHKLLNRKYSYDSESSDVHSLKRHSASPLLDAPVTLNTLKYKSLLNSSNDWNNRRKSYSFEDTSPLNEVMVQSNDTLAMESSTDSGICKSSEIVNDYTEDSNNTKDFIRDKRFDAHRDDYADHWHYKNKPTPFFKGPKMKTYKEHETVVEDPLENNIALQSTGKVTITVPITIEGADDNNHKFYSNDDGDRKVKKVEFCKTELHFAAESGRVNIIATDEKPPPSNDFRKRRSAFVPINDKFEKPITLFGERNDLSEKPKSDEFGIKNFNDTVEFDENTAATKSILKNKIPKPKPYLLGENMAFGETQPSKVNQPVDRPVALGVSLINKELETQRIRHSKETVYNYGNITEKSFTDSLRTFNKGSPKPASSSEKHNLDNVRFSSIAEPKANNDSIRHKLNALQMTSLQKPKTRQLRESDLTFFGIGNHQNKLTNKAIQQNETSSISNRIDKKITHTTNDLVWDNAFESVRLIKQVSSSAQNSEAESDDLPDYQNIPIKSNFAPVPTPRSRVKYKKPDEEPIVLKPIMEQVYDSVKVPDVSRRSRSRKQDEFVTLTSRSRSEPPKKHERENSVHKYKKPVNAERNIETIVGDEKRQIRNEIKRVYHRTLDAEYDSPVYANLNTNENEAEIKCDNLTAVGDLVITSNTKQKRIENKTRGYKCTDSLEKRQNSAKKPNRNQRTEKLSTPEHSTTTKCKEHSDSLKTVTSITGSNNSSSKRGDQRTISSQRPNRDKIIDKTQIHRSDKHIPEKQSPVMTQENIIISKDRNSKKTSFPILSKDMRPVNRDGGEKGSNTNSRRTSRRSEYVIKYDDKNGTVSSISKVRGGHSASRQKHSSKDRHKENSKDIKAKMQLPDHRIVNGRNEDRKWNAKIHVQRSCQLL